MTQKEVIEYISDETGYTKKSVAEVLESFKNCIMNSEEEVKLTNFGKFYWFHSRDRTSYDLTRMELNTKKGKTKLKFKCSLKK